MAHDEQKAFCMRVRNRWPHLFDRKSVLDCGSLDINGNNRYLFHKCQYTGIDITAGPNVDHISRIHEWSGGPYGVVISTECLEHDEHSSESIQRMIDLTAHDGLILITCATTGRAEHGTEQFDAWASPATTSHYRNIDPIELIEPLSRSFRCWSVEVIHSDVYAWGLDPKR
jgi:hypothetical protein